MTTDELWRPVPRFEGLYEVSSLGRVRSVDVLVPYTHWRSGARLVRLKRGRIKSAQLINSGYQIVHLYDRDVRSALLVHRLVAEAFLPNPLGLPEVNHRDGVKPNNAVYNLEWICRTKNMDHAVDVGLNVQAIPVVSPDGRVFPSIARAARITGLYHQLISDTWERA